MAEKAEAVRAAHMAYVIEIGDDVKMLVDKLAHWNEEEGSDTFQAGVRAKLEQYKMDAENVLDMGQEQWVQLLELNPAKFLTFQKYHRGGGGRGGPGLDRMRALQEDVRRLQKLVDDREKSTNNLQKSVADMKKELADTKEAAAKAVAKVEAKAAKAEAKAEKAEKAVDRMKYEQQVMDHWDIETVSSHSQDLLNIRPTKARELAVAAYGFEDSEPFCAITGLKSPAGAGSAHPDFVRFAHLVPLSAHKLPVSAALHEKQKEFDKAAPDGLGRRATVEDLDEKEVDVDLFRGYYDGPAQYEFRSPRNGMFMQHKFEMAHQRKRFTIVPRNPLQMRRQELDLVIVDPSFEAELLAALPADRKEQLNGVRLPLLFPRIAPCETGEGLQPWDGEYNGPDPVPYLRVLAKHTKAAYKKALRERWILPDAPEANIDTVSAYYQISIESAERVKRKWDRMSQEEQKAWSQSREQEAKAKAQGIVDDMRQQMARQAAKMSQGPP